MGEERTQHSIWIDYGKIEGKGIKLIVKRLVRKLISFLIIPVIQQQNEINDSLDERIRKVEHYDDVAYELDGILQKQSDLFVEKSTRIEELHKSCIRQTTEIQKECSIIKNELRSLAGDLDYPKMFDRYERLIDSMETKIALLEKKVDELEGKHD